MKSAEEWMREFVGTPNQTYELAPFIRDIQEDALQAFLIDWDDGVPYCTLCRHCVDRSSDRAVLGTCTKQCRINRFLEDAS